MILHTKVSSARRALVGVVVAALFLACISLQTHIFWSAEEVGAKESWISATHPSKFSFVIKLLTYDRLHSLVRCLDSLTAADYGTQVVKLHLYIDHFPYSDISLSSPSSKSSLPSEAAVEKSLKESHALLDYVDRFTWIHGPKEIHYRIQNAGLQGQWLEAWWPTSDNEFAFVVEDDMYLSPLYFKYLTQVIETYYYNPSNYDPTVYGISLQRPRFVPVACLSHKKRASLCCCIFILLVYYGSSHFMLSRGKGFINSSCTCHKNGSITLLVCLGLLIEPTVIAIINFFYFVSIAGKHGNQLRVDNATHLFLYQLVGTWGQLLFAKPWKGFRLWYDVHKSKNLKPLLEGMVTTGWYHRSGERIWTPWFIKFAYCKGYFNLYTHFSNEQALSISYRDKGVNTKKEAGPDSALIRNETVSGLNLWEMKPLNQLKRYDYCFHEVKQGRVIENAHDVKTIIPSVQKNGTIILVNALGFREDIIRNWLCQFSKLSIRNFVILIKDHGIEKDLLLRGHAVMHFDSGLLKKENRQSPDSILYIERALTVIQAVTMILHAGYNIWLTDVSTLWLSNPFPLVHIGYADMLGFAVETRVSSEFLYIKGSKRTMSFWGNLHRHVLHQADSSATLTSSIYKQEYLGALIGMSKGVLNFKLLPSTLKVDLSVAYKNQSDGSWKLAAALLMGIPSNDSYTSTLKLSGLWQLDEELSCTGVYC
ncbi:hypothetical protein L7F22_001852 [Adiantum nelumboides]|nr:hypothetical protein [Adiantum nelumboides]